MLVQTVSKMLPNFSVLIGNIISQKDGYFFFLSFGIVLNKLRRSATCPLEPARWRTSSSFHRGNRVRFLLLFDSLGIHASKRTFFFRALTLYGSFLCVCVCLFAEVSRSLESSLTNGRKSPQATQQKTDEIKKEREKGECFSWGEDRLRLRRKPSFFLTCTLVQISRSIKKQQCGD